VKPLTNIVDEVRRGLRRRDGRDYAYSLASSYLQMAVNILVQLLLVPLYLAQLGKAEFGLLMILLGLINYAALGVGWLSGGMARLLGEFWAHGQRTEFSRAYLLSKLAYVGYAVVLSLIGLGIVWLGRDRLLGSAAHTPEQMFVVLALTALYFVAQYDFAVDRLALAAAGRQAIANLLFALSQLVYVAAVVPVLLAGGGLAEVMLCFLGGVVVARAASWLVCRRLGLQLRPGQGWAGQARPLLRRLLGRTGVGYLLAGSIGLSLQADTLIVGWIAGTEAAADFVLVWKVAEVGVLLLSRLPEQLQPYIIHMDARAEHTSLRAAYGKGLKLMWLIAAAAGLGYALLGPWLVRLWVGDAFAPDTPLGFALAGGAVFWLVAARWPAAFAFAMVRLRALITVSGIELLVKLALTIALFPRLGFLAPLAALNIVHICGIAWAYLRMGRRL